MAVQDISSRFALDVQSLGGLRRQAKEDPQAALREAARQLEASFVNILLKTMRESSPEDGLFGNGEDMKLYTQMLDQQLSQNMASGKGLGLADMMVRQLAKTQGSIFTPADLLGGDKQKNGMVNPLLDMPLSPRLEARRILDAMPAAEDFKLPELPSAGNGGGDKPATPKEFVTRLWPHAVEAAQSLGFQPHFLIGHAALESGWGAREIKGADGESSYNLFGIKAGRDWTGKVVETMTTEYVNGKAEKRTEQFRAYESYAEAFRDYAKVLSQKRYASALNAYGDVKGFAAALQRGGYATDPLYANKLERVVNGSTLRGALMELG